jgi:hypothetical protein
MTHIPVYIYIYITVLFVLVLVLEASADDVEDCGQKGNFKCGDGNSKVLIAITLVVLFFVVIVAIVVW